MQFRQGFNDFLVPESGGEIRNVKTERKTEEHAADSEPDSEA